MAFPVLFIAGIFFLVTMALAVGPLLMCRLFVGSPEPHPPRQSKQSIATGVVAACGSMVAVAVAVASMYFVTGVSRDTATREEDQPATVAGPTELAAQSIDSEQSLFDGRRLSSDPVPAVQVASHRLSLGAILVPLLLVTTMIAVVSDRLRGGLLRLFPIVIAGGLLVVLFVRSSTHHQYQQAVVAQHHAEMAVAHVVQRAQLDTEQMLAAAVTEKADHPLAGSADVTPERVAATEPPSTNDTADTAVAPEEVAAVPGVTVFEGTNAVGVPREALPEWTVQSAGDGSLRVIKSGQHATVELAETQLLAELNSLLRTEFLLRHPEARGWQPPNDVVLHSGSIRRRAVERSQITVGESSYPMYEAYWQVEPTIADELLYNAWRPTVVRQRLVWLGGGLGLLTLLLGSLAAGLRVDEQTGGKRRKALTLGTLALWAVVGGAVLFVA